MWSVQWISSNIKSFFYQKTLENFLQKNLGKKQLMLSFAAVASGDFPCYFFVLIMLSDNTSAAYIQVHFSLDFIMEAKTMNQDQTAPREQSDLGLYWLQ